MLVTITVQVDTEEDLSDRALMLIQAEMYRCCHNLEEHRFTKEVLISCKPLDVDGVKKNFE